MRSGALWLVQCCSHVGLKVCWSAWLVVLGVLGLFGAGLSFVLYASDVVLPWSWLVGGKSRAFGSQ